VHSPSSHAGALSLLDRPLGFWPYYGLALLLALGYSLHLFPWDFVTGRSGFWFDTRTDPTQHITGMWAFVHDAWRFPLLHTRLLNAPEGVSAAFTDSIPLAALLFKPVYGLLPHGSHYFGFWVLGCYLGQGLVGAWAASAMAGRTLAGCIAGSLLPVMMPALMIRIPHAALLAQGLLLAMLVFYWQLMDGRLGERRFVLRAGILLLLSAGIHLYLTAMLYTLYLGALVAWCWRGPDRAALARAGIAAVLPALPLLGMLVAFGYLSAESGLPPVESGYDQSSMNLLSPLLGTHLAPSRFLPADGWKLDATGLQIDGHNYLGLGLLVMLLAIPFSGWRSMWRFLLRHWVMLAVLAGLTVYALSNVVYLGGREVLRYPLPDVVEPLTRIFRGSGRFFWPVGYALLLVALGYYLTRGRRLFRLALLLAVGLQYADTAPHRAYLAEAAGRKANFAYDRALWDARVRQASAVYLLPVYGCGAAGEDALFLQYFTALHAVPLNTGFVARVASDCEARMAVLSAPRKPGELFVFKPGLLSEALIDQAMGGQRAQWCAEEPIGLVCQVPASLSGRQE